VRTKKTLENKHVLVAVTGSVAAYKSIELVRELRRRKASVRVIMTPDTVRFVTPLSLSLASGHEAVADMFAHPLSHIELPKWADAYVVAPASAHTVGKFASALAPDIVSACYLAFHGPVLLAPAMNWRMYTHPVFQEKLSFLKGKGVREVSPEEGSLACGEEGVGRMASIADILSELEIVLCLGDLEGKKIVVTAGPTREHIDPVRFLSNRSSGKMGFALARAARARGAQVVLITGPVSLPEPEGVETIRIETAAQMCDAVTRLAKGADALIMAAAVADCIPAETSDKKREKAELLNIKLKPAEDILHRVSKMKKRPFLVGFAAQTGPDLAKARGKMVKKKLDMLVFNDVNVKGAGFDTDTNKVTIMDGVQEEDLPLMSKDEVARVILERIAGKVLDIN